MKAETELLPCPFDGGVAVIEERANGYVVMCDRRFRARAMCPVNARTRSGMLKAEAIALWNTRAHSELEAEVKRLRTALEHYADGEMWSKQRSSVDVASANVYGGVGNGYSKAREALLPASEDKV